MQRSGPRTVSGQVNIVRQQTSPRVSTWRSVLAGAAAVASVVILIDLTNRYMVRIPNPPIIYLLAVVYMSYRSGVSGGLAGAAVSLAYATQFFSLPNQPFQYSPDNLGRLLVLFAVTPIMAGMVGRLRAQSDRQVAAMRELSEVDTLTGAANRRVYFRDGERDLLRAHRLGIPIAVVAIDVDEFKRVNDTHGHAAGDTVLQTVAERIRQATRDIDVVARIGGEEFAVLLAGSDDRTAVMAAERIRAHLNEAPISTAVGDLRVTASFGVALVHTTEDLAGAMARADKALYLAKRSGRDQVVLAVPATDVVSRPSRALPARETIAIAESDTASA